MFRINLSLFLVILLSFTAIADEKGDVLKAGRRLDRAERSLQSLEKSMAQRTSLNESIIRSWNLKIEKAKAQVEKAQTLLASYNGSEASAQKNRLSAITNRRQELEQKINQRSGALKDAETMATSADGQAATEEFQRLADLFRDVNAYLLNVKEDPKLIVAYRQGLAARQHLRQKYSAALSNSSNTTFDLRAAASQAEMNLKGLEQTIERSKTQLPSAIEQHLKKALDDAQTLQKNGAYGAWEVNVEPELRYARLRVEKLKAVTDGSVTQSMEARVKSVTQKLEATKQKFRAQIIANNKPPADRFRGADAAIIKQAIRKKWAAKYPSDKVTDIRIMDSAWSAFSGYDWDGGNRNWRAYNFDRVRAAVVVTSGSSRYKFGAQVVRQNLQGSRLDVFLDRPNPVTDPKMILP